MITQRHSQCVLQGIKTQFSPIAFLQHLGAFGKYLVGKERILNTTVSLG